VLQSSAKECALEWYVLRFQLKLLDILFGVLFCLHVGKGKKREGAGKYFQNACFFSFNSPLLRKEFVLLWNTEEIICLSDSFTRMGIVHMNKSGHFFSPVRVKQWLILLLPFLFAEVQSYGNERYRLQCASHFYCSYPLSLSRVVLHFSTTCLNGDMEMYADCYPDLMCSITNLC
jgi:hypothetical protein